MSRKCPCALRKGAASCDVMWKRRYLREQRGLIRCALPFAARRPERATRHGCKGGGAAMQPARAVPGRQVVGHPTGPRHGELRLVQPELAGDCCHRVRVPVAGIVAGQERVDRIELGAWQALQQVVRKTTY